MHRILVKKQSGGIKEKIRLASSKSESNRALIINALSGFGGELQNLSTARDTQTMIRLLKSEDAVADVLDAGTTMRFLTAYFAITNQTKTMTGTPRMCERPIGILVDALRSIGCEIDYLGKEGYPPTQLKGFSEQKNNEISIRGDVSSQYISALLMISPLLPNGLTINLLGEIGSIPYITMTIKQMEAFGVKVAADWDAKKLSVEPQEYKPTSYKIESDWSGASYWYSVVALAENDEVEIELLGLKENSLQGDSVIVNIMSELGVKSTFTPDGVLLQKTMANPSFEWDFTDCPDLAQTVAVVLVAKKIKGIFTGLESLKIKETDRVVALQNELAKIGGTLEEVEAKTRYEVNSGGSWTKTPTFETYDDHRMAMAFAPLAMILDVIIEEPGVVAKSYPSYWEDLGKIVSLEELN
ncbi:3-phosphoshikimate 1-carboxyvinyltransferase [Lacihabitans sp. CS3-21]|uniref:3-phosphoshikimate 1-carboxyvinyltransferase n=1 Tax=Lacihabitans sp. CS3-21 TaxID=2487332 RepID=UPI0020CC152C|nr:3-phosphoshikimate 1-carboxyvinyltransferase [Lacihabitans sp. CS3-21]MCP9748209.1 3-phosphoshikimate 1-carboxyvinyltransferase [Lacihabitans sp. CS3-21]